MFSEKLISLLQTFTKPELNRFRKYLQSPYLNDQQEAIVLFDLIDQSIRKGRESVAMLTKEKIWSKIYAPKAYNDAILRRLASDLSGMALHFWSLEFRKQDPLAEALDLQWHLGKPELQKHLSSVERQIERQLGEQEGKSGWAYFNEFRYHWNIFERSSKSMNSAGYVEKLFAADQALEHFYIVQKLKSYISWLVFKGFRSTEQDFSLVPGFLEHVQSPQFKAEPLILIYHQVILCLTEPDDESHFTLLMQHLDVYGEQLTKLDLRECYHIAQNYCAFKINQGKTAYYSHAFEIFKKIIDRQLLLEENRLTEGVFKNIIACSNGVGAYEWTEQFIENYAPFLPDQVRENARSFNLSQLYFHQKRYPEVIEILRNLEYSDVVYALGAKLTLLRTYYELDEYQALDSLIESFRIYLRRNTVLSKSAKKEYHNYLLVVKNLSRLAPSDRKGLEQLREKFLANSSAMPKKWLLMKIDEWGKIQ